MLQVQEMKNQKGFTLVEIAIVLVVIGLLLGGVLKGQELLENGRIRKALNDFNTIAAATFTYQDRYRRLPGDDDEASRFTGVTASTEEGDDNGLIGSDGTTSDAWDSSTANDESRLFWLHLREDGLVERSGQEQPDNAFNGTTGVMFENLGIVDEHVICMDNVNIKSGVIMDTRIDDGDNQTGVFRLNTGASNEISTSAPATAVTVATGGRGTVCREL